MTYIFIALLLMSCGPRHKAKDHVLSEKLDLLTNVLNSDVEKVKTIVDEHGWPDDACDSMIYAGKLGTWIDVDIEAAQYPEKGKFGRRPPKDGQWCWMPNKEKNDSGTTWSRDMFVCGLGIWAWHKNRLDILEQHASYGFSHAWKMGEGSSDRIDAAIYTPNVIGLLYSLIYGLGGKDHTSRHLPSTYPEGLERYHAHLQMCQIHLRSEVAEKIKDADAIPKKQLELTVSNTMYERILEHSGRVPDDAFFQYLRAKYTTGDMTPVIDLILSGGSIGTVDGVREYGRCGEHCELPFRIFVSGLVLRYYKKQAD